MIWCVFSVFFSFSMLSKIWCSKNGRIIGRKQSYFWNAQAYFSSSQVLVSFVYLSSIGLSSASIKMVFRTELKVNEFSKLVDSNQRLIGINDGIYDLDRYAFQPFNVNDAVTLSTECDFPWETEHDPENEIDFFVDAELRSNFWHHLKLI